MDAVTGVVWVSALVVGSIFLSTSLQSAGVYKWVNRKLNGGVS